MKPDPAWIEEQALWRKRGYLIRANPCKWSVHTLLIARCSGRSHCSLREDARVMNDPTDEQRKNRRIYGRGFADALRLFGIKDIGAYMNESKYRQIEEGLTRTAKKVLAAIPMQEAWTLTQIISELGRMGIMTDKNIVEGCISALKHVKFVREPSPGMYTQIPRPVAPLPPPPITSLPQRKEPMPQTPTDPMERLAVLAKSVRAIAVEIEEVALEVEARITQVQRDSAKLKQLQDLLKGD